MKAQLACSLALLISLTLPSLASGSDSGDRDCCGKTTCFNLYCQYKKKKKEEAKEGQVQECRVAIQFMKRVSSDGREIFDYSNEKDNPKFQVQCDQQILYNNSAHRYTDELGTRIQVIGAPYPAILLPRGSLHDQRHYETSSLQLENQDLEGYCYIYTGPAL